MEFIYPMTHDQFSAELEYHVAMSLARTMLKRGILNEAQYSLIDTRFAQEFKPFFSTMLKG